MTVAVFPKNLSPSARRSRLLRDASFRSLARQLGGMVLIAFVLRLAVVLLVYRQVAAPTVDHNQFGWEMGWVARSLALHQGFSSPFLPVTGPTALMPPVYPFLLAGVFRLFGLYTPLAAFVILAFNSLASALTCVPLFFTARRAFDRRTARWAGWLWALYPFSIYFSADRVWDYALTGLLFSCCLWFALRLQQPAPPRLWFAFGLLSSLTCLSNPSVVLLFPAFLLIALYARRKSLRPALRGCMLGALAFAIGLAPWAVRNYAVFHTFIPIRSGFWLEFEAGNHGETFDCNPPSSHPASNAEAMQRYQTQGETLFMSSARARSQAYVIAHPAWFAVMTARRVLRFWTVFWSVDPVYRQDEPFDLPAGVYCTTMLGVMLCGLWQRRRTLTTGLAPYLATLLIFPLPYYLSHSSPDYRQPIEPLLISLVAFGLLCLKRKLAVARRGAVPAVPYESPFLSDAVPAHLMAKLTSET